jgi:uncharacterized protein YecT (DUF1311 family)
MLAQTPEWDAFYAKQAQLRKRGDDVLQRERERRKANLCSNSTNGAVGISSCLSEEFKTTEANYLAYVRAIGALLRLTPPGADHRAAGAPITRLAFDDTESIWQSYREKACTAVLAQWQGGSIVPMAQKSCLLDLAWSHIEELANLYHDLWH